MKKKINTIGVSAPADYIIHEKFIQAEKNLKKNYGITVVAGKNLFNRYGCFAGTDEERAEDINNFIYDEKIDAIFFARGGYGSAALLDKIDYKKLKTSPKIFMGYSDATSILVAVNCLSNAPSIYGPMITTEFNKKLNKLTLKTFNELLINNNKILLSEKETAKINIIKLVDKKFSGKIIAGCLTVFNTLIGTPYLKMPNDAILFLEDTNEEVYRIDRQLTHLKNAGILSKCKAIVLDFKNTKPAPKNKETVPLKKRLLETLNDYNINILSWNCFGHRPNKILLPYKQQISFDFLNRNNPTITIEKVSI
jgi:muramoyltetrapeptide carboxypeptidase